MRNYSIRVTDDYEKLVPFFIENDLEFTEDEPVPTDLVKCWEAVEEADGTAAADRPELIGGLVLAKREGEFIIDGIAVAPEYRGRHLGRDLLTLSKEETLKRKGDRIYLVARAPGFFRRYGFKNVSRSSAPNFFECFTCPQYGITCHPEVMVCDLKDSTNEGSVE